MALHNQDNIATLRAEHSGLNIFLKWTWMNSTVPLYVKKTLVFFIQEGDTSVIVLQRYDNSSNTEYTMKNVAQDVKYNFCIRAIMTNAWHGVKDPQICTNVTNSRYEMSALVGSIAGALLALILIVLLVCMSKRVKKSQKISKANLNDNSQRQRYDSAFESQFDSVANREDNSFYDELVTSEVSYLDSSFRLSGESSLSSGTTPSVVSVGDNPPVKTIKKRTSLIEEESSCSQPSDSWMYSSAGGSKDGAYQKITDSTHLSPLRHQRQPDIRIMETCIDEVYNCDLPNTVNVSRDDHSTNVALDQSLKTHKYKDSSKLVTDCVENL